MGKSSCERNDASNIRHSGALGFLLRQEEVMITVLKATTPPKTADLVVTTHRQTPSVGAHSRAGGDGGDGGKDGKGGKRCRESIT